MNIKQAKKILKKCTCSETANHNYDIFRGGFVWDDEMPNSDTDYEDFDKSIIILARVIAYRASLTLGEPQKRYEKDWLELKRNIPSWPGFREERIYGKIERELRIVKKQEEKCLKQLIEDFDEEESI